MSVSIAPPPQMLRLLALQLETAMPEHVKKQLPDYLQSSASDFISGLRRFADEQEGKNNGNSK